MVNLGRVISLSSRLARRSRFQVRYASSTVGFVSCGKGHAGFVIPSSGYEPACADPGFKQLREFHSSLANYAAVEGSDSEHLSEGDYHNLANETLHHLQERIEKLGEELTIEGFDTDYAEGVLTVRLGHLGTYVINKQTPNRQIWFSSPVSGPARFDWQDSKWVYLRTNAELQSLLQKELSDLVGKSVDLS